MSVDVVAVFRIEPSLQFANSSSTTGTEQPNNWRTKTKKRKGVSSMSIRHLAVMAVFFGPMALFILPVTAQTNAPSMIIMGASTAEPKYCPES